MSFAVLKLWGDGEPAQEVLSQETSIDEIRKVAPVNEVNLEHPIFDIVRVERTGHTVIAGKFRPKATIEIMDGEISIGSTQANKQGHWVLIPEQGLSVGSHELSIRAYPEKSYEPVVSEQTVLIIVPEKQDYVRDLSRERSSDYKNQALAILKSEKDAKANGRVLSGKERLSNVPYKLLTKQDFTVSTVEEGGIYLSNRTYSSTVQKQPISSDFVTFDGSNHLLLAGKGPAGKDVYILLQNDIVAKTKIGINGRWHVKLDYYLGTGKFIFKVFAAEKEGQKLSATALPVQIIQSRSGDGHITSLDVPTEKWQYRGEANHRWIILAL